MRRVYNIDDKLDTALKQDTNAAVEETYLYVKKQRYIGFHGVTAKSLMDHLMVRSCKIRPLDLEACRQALTEPIEVDCLISVYFEYVDDVVQLSQDGKTPFTPAQIV